MLMNYVEKNVQNGEANCSCALKGVCVCVYFPHFMVTSSNGSNYALLALCAGNSPVTGEFPSQRPVTRSFDVFFDLRLEYTVE